MSWEPNVQLHDAYLQLSWATEAQDQIAFATVLRPLSHFAYRG